MLGKKKKVYLSLTAEERKLLVEALFWFRNDVIQKGGPTEDIDALLLKIMK